MPAANFGERHSCLCGALPRRTWTDAHCYTCDRWIPGLQRPFERTVDEIRELPETADPLPGRLE